MQTRLLWRRSATALGLYGSVALGFLAGIVAARRAGPAEYGLFTLAVFAAGVFQLLFDLTVEEVMIKYGFRYSAGEQWGRLRTLYRRAMVLKSFGAADRDSRARDPRAVRGLDLQCARPGDAVPDRGPAPDLVRPRGSGRRRAHAGRALRRSAPGTSSSPSCCGRQGSSSARSIGVTEAVLGLVLGQVAGSIAVSWAAIERLPPVPCGGARAAWRGPQGDHPVRDHVEHRLRDRLAPGRDRPASARCRIRPERGRLLPGRAVPADGPPGADLAGADDPDHGADPRLGGRRVRQRVHEPAAVQARRARAHGRLGAALLLG